MPSSAPEWITSTQPVAYETAVAWMEERANAIAQGTAPEAIWLLEHPPLYTAGTSAKPHDLTDPDRFPVIPITAPASGSPMPCSI